MTFSPEKKPETLEERVTSLTHRIEGLVADAERHEQHLKDYAILVDSIQKDVTSNARHIHTFSTTRASVQSVEAVKQVVKTYHPSAFSQHCDQSAPQSYGCGSLVNPNAKHCTNGHVQKG